jgi:hypothetical protein
VPRGQRAAVGDTKVNDNGYQYTRTADRGWVGTHQLVMEGLMGRQLLPGEYVSFNSTDKLNFSEDNLQLRRKGDKKTSINHRLAQIEARIEELEAERDILIQERNGVTVNA